VGRGLPGTLALSARFELGDAPLEVGEFRLRALEELFLNLESSAAPRSSRSSHAASSARRLRSMSCAGELRNASPIRSFNSSNSVLSIT